MMPWNQQWSVAATKNTSNPEENQVGDLVGDGEEPSVGQTRSVAEDNISQLMQMMAAKSSRRQPKPSLTCSYISAERCGDSLPLPTEAELFFCTPNESSCVVSFDGKERAPISATVEMVADVAAARDQGLTHHAGRHPLLKRSERQNLSNRSMSKAENRAARKAKQGGRQPRAARDARGLSVADKEDDEEAAALRGRRVCFLSSDDAEHFSGSSNLLGSENEISDVNSVIEHRLSPAAAHFLGLPEVETRRKEAMEKLMDWKEARIMKYTNRLERKEASIERWENMQTAKAEMEMKKLEEELKKRRDRGMKKMMMKIRGAAAAADRKRTKNRAKACKRITNVAVEFEEMVLTGKSLWLLLCL